MDNAMTNIDAQMKAAFQGVFPEYAARMEAAKTDEDLTLIYGELVAKCRENLNSAVALAGGDPIGIGAARKDVPLLLTPELQKALSAARLDKVKTIIVDLVTSLAEISKLKKPPPEMLASALISAGCVTAVWPTPQAVLAIGQVCSSSSSEAVLLGSVTATLRAAPAGMSIGVVFAAILLVVAVLSVIIYVLVTERKCVILFVNELDAAVTFKGAHFDHGDKDSLSYSESIPEAIVNPDLGVFPWAGFVIADRKKDFYGTQFGFSYKYGARSLSVGALCGLSNPGWLSKGNQCWCAIDNSAARVSEKLLDAKKLSHDAVKGNLKLTVNCNSHSGSPAFFIARAHSG